MVLLAVRDVKKHYGPEPVLAGVTFEVREGERASLVGPNGAGKTTLLRILTGNEEADSGTIEFASGAKFGFLEQHPQFELGRTVWDEARDALRDLIDLATQAEALAHEISSAADEAERKRLGVRFDHLQHELHRRDGYHLDHKIERVLDGLGFARSAYRQPVAQLSGGQQNRLLLARLLLAEPDLLLLDEPSNHLDIEATQWLEEFLIGSPQALVVVSHDRYFLDKVTNRTLELFRGTVDSYTGNFTAYRRQKAERLEVQKKTFERQQTEIAKLEDFVRKNHYGQKHAQAEDRRKKLERIERVEPPREIFAPAMAFPTASRTGDIVLRVEHLSKGFHQPERQSSRLAPPDETLPLAEREGYTYRPLFVDLSFDILRGEKWGLLGPNGSGKTTLIKCLLGEHALDAGRVIFGAGVKAGYFDQLLTCINSQALVVDAIRPGHKEFFEAQRRDLLARFGVLGEMAFQTVGSLSGGERNRTALALLAASDANFLILDEPTNHLDLWARDALERALREFDGSVLFVSHDRYFLNQVADHLLVVEPGRFRVIDGNYDTYLHLVKQGLAGAGTVMPTTFAAASGASKDKPAIEPEGKKSRPDKPERRKRKFPYRKTAEIEAEIFARESRIEELHQALASPELLRDGERVKMAMVELDSLQALLKTLYEHWEEASELN